ncbi:MAG: tetratricopeptide repeat protein [Bacteroidota bacterium]
MKRFLFFAIFLLALCIYATAEEPTLEGLEQVVKTQQGKQKVQTLNQLSAMFLTAEEAVKASEYAQEALELAKSIGDEVGIAAAYDNLGFVFQSKYDYTNAMKSFVDALKLRNDADNEKGIATSKNNIGKVFLLQEDTKNAIENLTTALELREKISDVPGAAETHKNLADVYLLKKLYGKAKEHYRQAMDLKISLNDLSGAAAIASFLGNIVRDLGDSEGALVYFSMSLDLNNSLENLPGIAEDHGNIALAYYDQGSYEEALDANDTAYRINKKVGDQFRIAECNKNFGMIYAAMGEKEEADRYLQKSASVLKKVGDVPGTQLVYKSISDTYVKLKNYPKAYEYQIAFSKSRDRLFSEEKSRAMMELTTKYESEFAAEKQQQMIEALEKDKVYNARMQYFLIGMVALALLLLVVMFMSYRRKQRDNQLLMTKNAEINRQKEEIDVKNGELEESNTRLDALNQKLVDEMAERESLEKSSFARDRFLATMSHEMRTPMNIIIGLTHLLLEENPREDQVEHLRTLQFSANNLVVFINDVLDFSKIEAGKLNLESRLFQPQKTFDEVRQRFGLPARDKGLKFYFEVDNKIPRELMGDPTRLNQILTNLVGNAINSTEEGSVSVNVSLKELSNSEATLLVEVEDTGNGIDKERLDEMFREFSRNPKDIFEGYENADLGLAITKRLVDLQNGKIDVESQAGKGTTFIIYLPFRVPAAAERKAVEKKDASSYTHLSGNKILLVEDNKINQLVVAKMLRKLGIEVITADNGFEALDAFENSYFDLVLMDIQMPGMDGYRATAEIRKSIDPRKRDVPIIALTASAFLTEKEKAKLFGMNDHVGKPFGPDDLLMKISNCLHVYKNT